MQRLRVPGAGRGRPRTRPQAVLGDRAYSSRDTRAPASTRHLRSYSRAIDPGRSPPTLVQRWRSPVGFDARSTGAATCIDLYGPWGIRYRDALFPVSRYHPFFTYTDLPAKQAGITHRHHAIIETVFADLIDGPLAHLTSGRFGADATWALCAAIAHNLLRAAGVPAGDQRTRARVSTLRRGLFPPRPGPAWPARNADRSCAHQLLALVQTLSYVVAQHDRIQAATTRASLIHLPNGSTETPTGKAWEANSCSMPAD